MKTFRSSEPHTIHYLTIITCLTLMVACVEQPDFTTSSIDKTWAQEKSDAQGAYFEINTPDVCHHSCSLRISTDLNIHQVIYQADEYRIGMSDQKQSNYMISYEFSVPGSRQLFATGYNIQGDPIVKTSKILEVIVPGSAPDRSANHPLDIPYFYQYDNYYSPHASCQNTSIAMVLKHLGVNIVPDDITARYGKDYAQSPAGLADVFNTYAERARLSKRIHPTTSGTLHGLRTELDRGVPVIVHGYFTRSGHVLVVTGYDQNGYYVNDPAGRWSQTFKGNYGGAHNAQAGRNIYYSKQAFEAAIATSNGYNSLPLWYHTLR